MLKEKINNVVKTSALLSHLKLIWFKKKWRKINPNNFTEANSCFNVKKVRVGVGTYGKLDVRHFGNEQEELEIGHYCSIGPEVTFLLGGEHEMKHVSTFPFAQKYLKTGNESITSGKIVVEDDVWIGYGAVILSGVHLKQGSVVAAGSVVTKDVPPYAIVGGTQARVIRYRFEEAVIDKLLKVDFSKIDEEFIKKHHAELCETIGKDSQLEWLPMK